MTIKGIQDKIRKGKYRFSDHAVKRMVKRYINRHEVEEAMLGGEIEERLLKNILTINTSQVVLFMAKHEKEETCMFKFHYRR